MSSRGRVDLAAHRLGAMHERRLQLAGERKKGGAYYTPGDVVEPMLDFCLDLILEDRVPSTLSKRFVHSESSDGVGGQGADRFRPR